MTIVSFRNTLIRSIVAGIIIGIACSAFLSVSNRYFGGFLFSFALFSIIQFGFALFTGKVGYIPEKKPSYILEVLVALLGNLIGTGISALLLSFTGTWNKISGNASEVMSAKLADSSAGSFILAVFCGILMYLAIENAAVCRSKGYDTSLIFGTVLPVVLFIFCGFNHSIADSFYMFSSSVSTEGIFYILRVAAGNAVGGMLIPITRIMTKE